MLDGPKIILGVGAAIIVVALGVLASQPRDDATASANDAGLLTEAAVLFQCDLNVILAEHVTLAASATGSALGGRSLEYDAAVKSLDANSVELAAAVGSVYGAEAESAFLEGWRRHIGFFVDYTLAAAAKDETKKNEAIEDLHQYAIDVATLFNAANGLDRDAVISIVDSHVETVIEVIDQQAAGNPGFVYPALRKSIAQMSDLAGPLATATIAKYPEKFGMSQP